MIKITAPWTEHQVRVLKWWQNSVYHPYTCGNRDDGKHLESDKLIPTHDGWTCERCNYEQNWALYMEGII